MKTPEDEAFEEIERIQRTRTKWVPVEKPQRTEPVCPECKAEVLYECVACSRNNYPQQRTWVGLTPDERHEAWLSCEAQTPTTFARAIEAKLKEKNT
jgi:predicted Fe-S protein YdhL (DUF1289 family)